MINYQVITKHEEGNNILQELSKLLPFTSNKEGEVVRVMKEGKGICVRKLNGERFLTYENTSDFSRAWYLMIRNEEQSAYFIQEECQFEELTVMLDCSRNAVMKIDTLEEYLRQLAVLGYHSIQLYTEDTLTIDQEPYVGYMRGAYTKEEIRSIDAYCQIFGMELVPCIQTLAHLNQITRYERYQSMIDFDDILLVKEAKTYEYIEHVIATVADCFTSRRINIGMDEAHMLGLGKFLDQYGYQSRFEIMIEHLKRVQQILHKYGFQAMMWSDMFFRLLSNGAYEIEEDKADPALFALIPNDVELIYWDYYSNDEAHYHRNLEMHHKLSSNIGFASGAWKWTGFAPENGFSQMVGTKALKACVNAKISHFIVTCWGDNGAEASAFSVLPTLYYYAELAYDKRYYELGDQVTKDSKFNLNFMKLTGYSFQDFMELDRPNQIFEIRNYPHGNACKYLLYNDVLHGTFDSVVQSDTKERYQSIANRLNNLSLNNSPYAYLFHTLASLCEVLVEKADLGIRIYKAYQEKDKEQMKDLATITIANLISLIEKFQKELRFQWHKENKSFGFEIQLIRLGGLKERLQYTKDQMLIWVEGGILLIEELEGERLPFAYFDEKDISKLSYNLWNVIVSPSVMG